MKKIFFTNFLIIFATALPIFMNAQMFVRIVLTDVDENDYLMLETNTIFGELRIKNYELRIKSVDVFDVYGKKLQSKIVNLKSEIVIDISHLQTGIYFVKIQNKDNSIQTFKIIRS